MENSEKKHIFEEAGLGKAPYRFRGVSQKVFRAPGITKSGGSCDYCSTAITNCFELVSADGHEFVVGSECIKKAGDEGLMRIVRREESKKRREKKIAKLTETKAQLTTMIEQNLNTLANKPHPCIQGKTLLDYAQWMMVNAGLAGIKKLYSVLIRELNLGE